MIVDFRRRQEVEHAPLHINGSEVEKVSCFRFLGVNISNDLTWSDNFFCHVPDCFPSPITTSKETIVLFLHYINLLNCSQWFNSLGQWRNHSYDEEVEMMMLLCAYIKSNLSKKNCNPIEKGHSSAHDHVTCFLCIILHSHNNKISRFCLIFSQRWSNISS